MARPTLCVLVIGVCLAGCEDPGSNSSSASSTWSIDTIPVLDVRATTANDEVVFGSVAAATRLSTGHIVLADAYDPAIRYLSPGGELVRTVGKEGAGPNEFRSTAWLGQCGNDSVYVWDRVLARMTVLDAAGTIIRQFRVTPIATTIACSRTGTLAYFGSPEDQGTSAVAEMASIRYRAPLFVRMADAETSRGLGSLPLGEPRPLGRITSLAVTADRILVGTADSGSVETYTATGDSLAPLTFPAGPRQPTRRQYEAAIEKQVRMLPRASDREPVRELMRSMPMPEAVPAYTTVHVDPLDVVWVKETVPGDGETRFRLFGRGTARGMLRLPLELTIFEVGSDYLLAGYRDASDEEHLAVFRVRREP